MGVLEGKAIVITGSGRGIGAACAKGCAREGAAVVVNDVDAAEANETVAAIVATGGQAIPCVADVANWEEAGRLVQTCISTFGKIDGMVNNAAIMNLMRLDEFDPERALAEVNVNVMGPLYCTARAIKPMLAQKSGSIVEVTSGAQMGIAGMGVYGATKGAVASMIYNWAIELAGTGVRINGMSPFGVTSIGLPRDQPVPEKYAKEQALYQQPEANSPVIEFLMSDLSKDVHGQILRIDNGELNLYTHPAVLLPAAVRTTWTAEEIAKAFANEFKGRQVPCGIRGMKELPVALTTGFHARKQSIK